MTRPHAEARAKNLARLVENSSQADIAERLQVSASYVSQLLTGYRRIGDQTAQWIEQAFDLEPGWLDQLHDGHDEPASAGSVVMVPEMVSQGGEDAPPESGVGAVPFMAETLQRVGLKPGNAECFFAQSDDMAPTIARGDCLLLARESEQIRSGSVYVLTWAGEFRVRRLFRLPGGEWRVRADNSDRARFPDETVTTDEDGLSVVGRVIWRGGFL